MKNVNEIISHLQLTPHPEGGYFKETYRSEITIPKDSLGDDFDGNRNASTCIYFLLTSDTFSAFHKINQDEIWHFYEGHPIELHVISEDGAHTMHLIGRDLSNGQVPQVIVPGNHWFAAKVMDENTYGLVGCTVAPGFDFEDFILPTREELIVKYPQHEALITSFTRN